MSGSETNSSRKPINNGRSTSTGIGPRKRAHHPNYSFDSSLSVSGGDGNSRTVKRAGQRPILNF